MRSGRSLQRVLVLGLCLMPSVASAAPDVRQSLERLRQAQSTAEVGEIVKIAREIADEIFMAPAPTPRLTATVVGLFRKAEALKGGALSAEDAGRVGRLYLMLSESYADVAKRYLDRSVRETGNPEERVALGNAELYLGNPGAARREYLKVSERRPEDQVVLVNLAMAERALGDTASAYGRLRQVQSRPRNAAVERIATLAMADIQLASRDYSGARLEVQKLLRKWPSDREGLMMLKQIFEKEGKVRESREVETRLKGRAGRP